jgi:hypothetical protein
MYNIFHDIKCFVVVCGCKRKAYDGVIIFLCYPVESLTLMESMYSF